MADESSRAPADLRALPIPRPVRLTWLGKLELGFASLLLIAGCGAGGAAIWVGQREAAVRRLLEREGVMVAGRVTRKWASAPTPQSRIHYVEYVFEGGGRNYQHETYRRTAAVPYDIFLKIHPGDYLPVRYAPSDPATSRLPFELPAATWPLAVFAAIFLLFWRLAGSSARLQKKLLARGQVAEATVRELPPGRKGGCSIRYQFQDSLGNVITGNSAFAGFSAPAVGDTIMVVYDEKKPQRNLLYPVWLAEIRPG